MFFLMEDDKVPRHIMHSRLQVLVSSNSRIEGYLFMFKAFLSKIFERYAGDFEQPEGSVQRFLARYVNDPGIRAFLGDDKLTIQYLRYDWDLNGSYLGKP